MEWLHLIASIVAGLITAVPLAIKLVEYVKKTIKEKNWGKVLDIVMKYMTAAEKKFDNGADRKEWVLAMVEVSSETINYDIDMDVISELIDRLCNMSKQVNASAETGEVGE